MEDKVLATFTELLTQDPHLCGSYTAGVKFGVEVANGRCLFKLKALFEWTGLESEMTFLAFRRALYNSNLNSRLRSIGYKVELQQSTGHVDTSLYQLLKL